MPKPYLINSPVVLFDASCFLYIHGANPQYKRTLKDHIEGTLENLKSNRYIGFIDGKKNYRYDVATVAPYKGNRDKTDILEKFPFFYRVKEELLTTYGFHIVHGIEADDVVGIMNRRINPNQTMRIYNSNGDLKTYEITNYVAVIASIDKDLLQLPAFHYNLTKHTIVMSNETSSHIKLNVGRNKVIGTGYKFLYTQVLMGDTTDNIKGLEKCGPVGAYTILEKCTTEKECIETVKQAFFDKEQDLAKKSLKKEQDELLTAGIVVKLTIPSEEELWRKALKKYNEMRNLVFILRKNQTLGNIKVDKYKHNLIH